MARRSFGSIRKRKNSTWQASYHDRAGRTALGWCVSYEV